MGLILRTSSLANPGDSLTIKGSSLDYNEVDGNFMYLLTNMSGSTINLTGNVNITGDTTSIGAVYLPALSNSSTNYLVNYDTSTGQLFYSDTSVTTATASYITSSNVYGPSGANSILSSSYALSSSFALNAANATLATNATTASFINITGLGIIINGTSITSSLRSINGVFPGDDGNIVSPLVQTQTGTSASLVVSSSGAITGSLPDGLIWIINSGSGSGDSYIYSSGSVGAWYPIVNSNQAANDARYLKLTPQTALSGSLNMGGFGITNAGTYAGTASWASNAINASTASFATTAITASYALAVAGVLTSSSLSGSTNKIAKFTGTNTIGNSSITDDGTTLTMTTNIKIVDPNNPSLIYIGGTNAKFALDANYGGGAADMYINRNGTGNQAKLWFSTGTFNSSSFVSSGNGWNMGMTNGGTGNSDFKIGYADIYYDSNVVLSIASGSKYVGISKVNPQYNLDVSGTIAFPNLTTTSSLSNMVMINTSTGQLYYSPLSTSNAIALTGSTLYSTMTTSTISTVNSIFLGYNAGNNASLASSSVFLGFGAGDTAISASNSNFIGNTAGYLALNAQYSNFLGTQAGYGATSAAYSNFLGWNAGYSASNASDSIFIGSYTGQNATNALQSIFLGGGAGTSSTNASGSTFIGYGAGIYQSSASFSTLIGYNVANGYPINNYIGSNNIIIGTNITLPTGRANSINLGGIIFATGSYSNTATSPFSGSMSTAKVGIGQWNPQYTLDVSGSGNFSNGLNVTSSLNISGSLTLTGSFSVSSVTASLQGTASLAITASYITASGVIGTVTSASYALTASNVLGGGATSMALWLNNTTLTSSLIYQTSSFIGINKSNPSYSLDVSGSAYFSDSLTVSGTLIANSFDQSVKIPSISTSSSLSNIIMVNPSTGQLYYTSSAAVVGTPTLTGGATNRIPLWSGTGTLTTSSLYQSSSQILIGTTTSATQNAFHISGSGVGTGFRYSGKDSGSTLNYFSIQDVSNNIGSGSLIQSNFYSAYDNTNAYLNITPQTTSLSSTNLVTIESNATNIQGDYFSYIGDYNNITNGIYIEVDQAANLVAIPSGSVAIGKTTANATLDINGSVVITGSFTIATASFTQFITLTPQNPLPSTGSTPQGTFAVSGSGANCKPYFFNGTNWTALF